jgi:uncharacterized protein (TIGR02246 family)
MKTRLLGVLVVVGLTISFALPTDAQQRDLADSQTTQRLLAGLKAYNEAVNKNDTAAVAGFWTRDGVFVTTEGPITGREAIQKWWTDLYQGWHPKNCIVKVDGNAYHLIGTAGTEVWATGEWSETGQGKNGEALPIKGYWSAIYVHETDDWKILVNAMNTTPGSVLRVNQSFATQPAATPSPTANP